MFGFGKYSAQILTPPPISKKQITMPAKPKIKKEDLLPDFKHTPPAPQKEMVNGPQHYGGVDNPYEVIKVCEAWGLDKDAYLFNVVKYVARAGKKDPQKELEDLKKAVFYLERKIVNLENK
jgi:hypothetical protein